VAGRHLHSLKLRVENLPGGKVKVQGKAWKTGSRSRRSGRSRRSIHRQPRRAPGLFLDAEFGAFIDNIR